MLLPSTSQGPGVLESERLALVPGVLHGFTTRALGSVALASGTDLSDAVDLALAGPHAPWTRRQVLQVHGSRAVEAAAVGIGQARVEADALVASEPGDLLVIRVADCLAILVVALESGRPVAVSAIHAGWRGLVAGIIQESVTLLRLCRPSTSLVAAMGPSIGSCCFEIGPEVAKALGALGSRVLAPGRGDRFHADLPLAARGILEGLRVEVEVDSPPCTRCEPGRFHSYRADGAAAGRMAGFIGLER